MERADLSYANLENAQLLSVKGSCANMEGANLQVSCRLAIRDAYESIVKNIQGCNFEDPSGVSKCVLEGANLKGACLEGSNMAGVNLRVANLKNANLKNCNLRAAILAGADLEVHDLDGL